MRGRDLVFVGALSAVAVLVASCGSSTTSTGSPGGSAPGTTPGSNPATPPTSSTTPGGSAPGSAVTALPGSSWQLVTYRDAAQAMVPAVASAASDLRFGAGGQLSGTTGCNSFSGTYTTNGENLTITLGPSTLMGCVDPQVSAQEAVIQQQLPAVARFAITGDTLTLSKADGSALFTYRAAPVGLASSSWKVTGVNNGREAVVSSALTEKLTMEFTSDTLSGFGGCNQLSGPYTTTGTDQVKIGPVAGTEMACGGEADAVEKQFIAALGAATTYDITGSVLTLRDASGAMQVTATRGT